MVAAKTISPPAQQPYARHFPLPHGRVVMALVTAVVLGWEADWVLDLPAADLALGGEPVQQPGRAAAGVVSAGGGGELGRSHCVGGAHGENYAAGRHPDDANEESPCSF